MCRYTMPGLINGISNESCSLAGAMFEGNTITMTSYVRIPRQDLTRMTPCEWPCCCRYPECFDLVLSR